MVYGKGLDGLDSNRKPEQYASMKILLKPKDVKRVISDRKKLGMGALQVTYKGKKVDEVTHFPMETLRAGICNEDGEVDKWYYHPDWINRQRSDKLIEFPVFGSTNGKRSEIYVIQSYAAGFKYYSPCDYVGALPYAVLEEEIADLGYDPLKFPSKRAAELIDLVSREIQREDKMTTFKQNMIMKIKEKGY